MLANSWLSIFFRCANFAVLVAIGYYVYRKYLKGPLEEKVSQKEAVHKGLEEQGYFLEGKSEDLDEQRRQQEQHIFLLMQKIDEWHGAVIEEHQKIEQESRIFATRSAERIALKNEYVARHELQMQLAPKLINEAKNFLEKKYSNMVLAEDYTHNALEHLKRKRI